jgi:hypothetical protein
VVGRRHLQVFIGVTDGLDEQAVVGVSRDDGGAGVAAKQDAVARIEQELALDPVGLVTVALVAVLAQKRADPLFEELEVRRGEGGDRGGSAKGERREQIRPGKNQRRGPAAARRVTDPPEERKPPHVRMDFTTLPATSVSRKSRPLKR